MPWNGMLSITMYMVRIRQVDVLFSKASTNIVRNRSYYIIAHASKFVPPGLVRVRSDLYGRLQNVAFKRPDGKKVLIVENDGTSSQTFIIKFKSRWEPPLWRQELRLPMYGKNLIMKYVLIFILCFFKGW